MIFYNNIIAILALVSFASRGFAQDNKDSNYALNMGAKYFLENKFDEAIDWFGRSIRNKQHIAVSYAYKAGAEILSGRGTEGKADLDIGFSMDSTISIMYFYRGRQFVNSNEIDSAILVLKRGIANLRDADELYNELATDFVLKGMNDSAWKYVNEAIRIRGMDAKYIANQGAIKYNSGEYELARLYYKQALDMADKISGGYDRLALINIGFCDLKMKKRYDEAMEICEEIIKKFPDYYQAYALRALVNYDLGKKEKACADFMTITHIKGAEKEGLEALKSHGCPMP